MINTQIIRNKSVNYIQKYFIYKKIIDKLYREAYSQDKYLIKKY